MIGSIIVVADGEAKSYREVSAAELSSIGRVDEVTRTFLIKLVASISTSVSGRKLWTAARYPMRFW